MVQGVKHIHYSTQHNTLESSAAATGTDLVRLHSVLVEEAPRQHLLAEGDDVGGVLGPPVLVGPELARGPPTRLDLIHVEGTAMLGTQPLFSCKNLQVAPDENIPTSPGCGQCNISPAQQCNMEYGIGTREFRVYTGQRCPVIGYWLSWNKYLDCATVFGNLYCIKGQNTLTTISAWLQGGDPHVKVSGPSA